MRFLVVVLFVAIREAFASTGDEPVPPQQELVGAVAVHEAIPVWKADLRVAATKCIGPSRPDCSPFDVLRMRIREGAAVDQTSAEYQNLLELLAGIEDFRALFDTVMGLTTGLRGYADVSPDLRTRLLEQEARLSAMSREVKNFLSDPYIGMIQYLHFYLTPFDSVRDRYH
jgi:hypothetical protein